MGNIFDLAKEAEKAALAEQQAVNEGQNERKQLRLNVALLERVKKNVKATDEKYNNTSHFIRCSAILLCDLEELGMLEQVRAAIRKKKK